MDTDSNPNECCWFIWFWWEERRETYHAWYVMFLLFWRQRTGEESSSLPPFYELFCISNTVLSFRGKLNRKLPGILAHHILLSAFQP